jgi:branched-chain amino acid transport system substrate-binding protein
VRNRRQGSIPASRSPVTARARRAGSLRFRGGRAAALLVVLSVVGTACGARVGPYLGAAQGLGGSNVAAGPSGPSGAPGASSSGPTTASGTSSAPAASRASGPASGAPPQVPAGFDYTPQQEAAACRGTAGNSASAPGITPGAIQIGNVSGLSGPLSGSFPQGPQAVQALFDAVNAAGGICGRQLQLTVEDDGQNSSTNQSDVENLISKPVFAFAGSTSDADNGGVPAMEQADIPDFGFAINCDRSEMPNYWSVDGGSCYQPPGSSTYYIGDGTPLLAQTSGYLPKKMAFLAYSIPISAQAAQQFAYVYQNHFGGDVCYSDYSISPVSASLESDVEQMQAAGCQGVFTTLDVTGNAKLLQALQQQNVSLPYVATTFDGYTPQQISTAGESAAQGLIVGVPFTPLEENQPMDNMYKQQLAQYVPNAQPSGFGFLSWLAAQMMIYALLQAGRNPTRASLVAVLDGLQNYTAGGAVGPHAPSDRAWATCEVDMQVKGNAFVRKAPASGLFCGGTEVQASP